MKTYANTMPEKLSDRTMTLQKCPYPNVGLFAILHSKRELNV
jgi:hypothetical protein